MIKLSRDNIFDRHSEKFLGVSTSFSKKNYNSANNPTYNWADSINSTVALNKWSKSETEAELTPISNQEASDILTDVSAILDFHLKKMEKKVKLNNILELFGVKLPKTKSCSIFKECRRCGKVEFLDEFHYWLCKDCDQREFDNKLNSACKIYKTYCHDKDKADRQSVLRNIISHLFESSTHTKFDENTLYDIEFGLLRLIPKYK